MSDIRQRIENLSPEKRAVLEQRMLAKKSGALDPAGIQPGTFADINQGAKRPEGSSHFSPILPVQHDHPVPLSFSQERMWFIHQMEPDSAAYNMSALVRLEGPLNISALEHSFLRMMQRHEDLRTTFHFIEGHPVQIITPTFEFCLKMTHLQDLPQAEREVEAKRKIQQEVLKPFDLTSGPLFRAGLYQIDTDHHLLFLGMHHIISDAWSLSIILDEVTQIYNAAVEGRQAVLPALAIQYADYALWQHEWRRGPGLDQQLSYWREKLKVFIPFPYHLTIRAPRFKPTMGLLRPWNYPKRFSSS